MIFRWTLTKRATNKDELELISVEVEQFIENLKKRGHIVGQKDGSGLVGAVFQQGGRLEQKYVECATAVILDVDGKIRRGQEVDHEVVDPDWLLAQLPYRGVAHTSYNHSPALPKYRVILPLAEPVSPADFRRLWFWIYEKVQRKSDPACKNPDRMFYLPRCTRAALTAGWHWIQETHGPLLSLSMVPEDFRPHIDAPARRRKQGAHRAPAETRYASAPAEALVNALIDLPLYKWAEENPAELTREAWRGLATNLAAAVLDDEDAHELGANAFHDVSKADAERYAYGVCERTFRDALKSAREYGPMTYDTLILNGVPAEYQGTAKSPIAEARESLRHPKSRPPSNTTTTEGGTDDASASAADTEKESDIFDHAPDDFLFDAHHGWMTKRPDGEWGDPLRDQSFNTILLQLGLPAKSLVGFKAQIKHFEVREALYHTTDRLVLRDGKYVFNTYRPSVLTPKTGNWDDLRSLFLNLAGGEPDALEYVLDWMAKPLQSLRNDGKPFKMGTALVFLGEQGSGKGTAAHVLEQLYGETNVVTFGQEILDGRFNGMLLDKLFVVANEVMSSTNRSAATANKIKPWITDATIPVERKHAEMVLAKNNFNIIFTSNDERPVLLEKTDRRYSVFSSKTFDRTIVTRIYSDLLGSRTAVSAFFDHLLTRKVRVKYGELYLSDAREDLILASATSDAKFVHEICTEGWYAIAQPWAEEARSDQIRVAVHQDDVVLSSTLVDVYRDYCRRNGFRPRNQNQLSQTLEAVPGVTRTRLRLGALRVRGYAGLPMHPDGVDVSESIEEVAAPAPVPEAGDFACTSA